MTFTTKDETDVSTGTLEAVNANAEQSKFLRYDNARKVQSAWFDHTNGTATGYAERLNGSANEKYGLARSISVMPGDKINAEVYAKFVDTNSNNWTSALNTLLTQITAGTASAGTVIDGAGYSSSTPSFPFAGLIDKSDAPVVGPKAYLNWLVFDRDFVLLNGGYKKMSDVAKEYGQDIAHEYLASPDITITQPGYVYIYLSNEESAQVEVYFDDFKVTQVKNPVIASDDYYPFGLTFNSYQRENGMINNFLYNGKEKQDELGLDWMDYGARMYMPEIGRWGVIDPMAELSRRWTPYRYGFNNPLRFIDPDGKYEYSNGYTTTDTKTETGAVDHLQVSDDQMDEGRKDFASMLGVAPCKCSSYDENGNAVTYGDPSEGQMEIGGCPPGMDCQYRGATMYVYEKSTGQLMDKVDLASNAYANTIKGMADTSVELAVTIAAGEAAGIVIGKGIGWVISRLSMPAIRFSTSVQSVLGENYKSVGEVTARVKLGGLLEALGDKIGGKWVKVYEAGILNGEKVEVHYFRQIETREVFDVKIKYESWQQKAFKKLN